MKNLLGILFAASLFGASAGQTRAQLVCAQFAPVQPNAYLLTLYPDWLDPFTVCLPDGTPNPGYVDPVEFLAVYPALSAVVYAESHADVVLMRMVSSATAQATHNNAILITQFAAAWNSWAAAWMKGTIHDITTEPQPPASYIVIIVASGTSPDAPKFAVADQSGPPITAVPPVPAGPTLTTVIIRAPGVVGNRSNALGPDNYAVGDLVINPDGSVWRKDIDYSPFGPQVFWQCVTAAN